jgi:hypothetical protein
MSILSLFSGFLGKGAKKGAVKMLDPKTGYRTDEQERALFYFDEKNKQGLVKSIKGCFKKVPKGEAVKTKAKAKAKGCFPKKRGFISDQDYDAIVNSVVQRVNPKARGLKRLGFDESQIEKTVSFSNYVWGFKRNKSDWFENAADVLGGLLGVDTQKYKFGEDGKLRTNVFQVTYLFFTRNQVAAYQLTLSSDWDKHDEDTYEYHYKDITALNTGALQQDVIKDGELKYETVQNDFTFIVPGDSFSVSLGNNPTAEEEAAIQAMKQMIREKKA